MFVLYSDFYVCCSVTYKLKHLFKNNLISKTVLFKATPKYVNLNEIQWNKEVTTTFRAFNFGESPIHFKFISDKAENSELTINPQQATIKPGGNIDIFIQIKARALKEQIITIMYQIRLHEKSDTVVNKGKAFEIFQMKYFCLYPTIQVRKLFLYLKVIV